MDRSLIRGKTAKQFLFEVQLNWLSNKKGTLSAKDAVGTLQVATPPSFAGSGKPWTPEHYFLSAISSCFMTTFLSFAQRLALDISGFECGIIGQIEMIEGKYRFTNINLYPKIYIEQEVLREKTTIALKKTHQYCLITNSINATVFYHSEILLSTVSEKAFSIKKSL